MLMKGKVAIVTASSTGIGKATAFRLAEEGAIVIISNVEIGSVNETVEELKGKGHEAFGLICDVTKKEDRLNLINQTVEKYGRIDYVVPMAGVNTQKGENSEEIHQAIKNMWEINYHSAHYIVEQALPYLKKQKDSAVVFVSSIAGTEIPAFLGHYGITKTALISLTKLLAKQYVDSDIRVNCVCPGLIRTKFSEPLWVQSEQFAKKSFGIKRLGEPQQIANVIKFLLSTQASYINGEAIIAAGRPGQGL